jgi:hypothetical protein
MQSGRYDFIAAPTTVTKERAENMLFSAGYLWTAYNKGHALQDAPGALVVKFRRRVDPPAVLRAIGAARQGLAK